MIDDERFSGIVEEINTGSPVADGRHSATELLDAVYAWLGRFVIYPSVHAKVAHTLWIGHAHLMDVWDSTPRISFLSPEPASGKTRALEVTEPLVPDPVEAVNVTPAYLFRKVGESSPTVLYDEIDTVFGPRAKENEEIRGLLNAGHRHGAVAGRCAVHGKTVVTEEIPAYCAVAFAGLGDLPDTIMSRSIVIRMRRRSAHEAVEPWRRRQHAQEGHLLRAQLAGWASQIRKSITWPAMPNGVADRDADVWEALLAVADAAGGHWPKTAREAAVALVRQSREAKPSLGIQLLQDLRTIFGETEALWTDTILERLNKLEESPWSDLRGRPLDARGLSSRLKGYEVSSVSVRIGDAVKRGYRREHLWDAWGRYLSPSDHPPSANPQSTTSATTGTRPTQPHGGAAQVVTS